MIVWFLSVIGCPTRNERHATFALARHGTLTGRLGKFPSHSRPSPHNPPLLSSPVLGRVAQSSSQQLSDVPPMPCLERASEWLVPVYPNGDAGLRDVFLPGYPLLFPAAAICAFNLGALNPGESRPNTSAQSRGNFRTFTRCPPPSTCLLASSQVYLVLYLQKEKKKKRTVLQRCTEKITWPLHKTEFIWCGADLLSRDFFFFLGVGGKCKVSLASVEIFPCCIHPMWGRRWMTSSQPPKTEAENIPVDPLWAIWVIRGVAKGNRSFSSLFEIRFQLWNISPCASTRLHPAGGRLEGPQHFTIFRHQSALLFAR